MAIEWVRPASIVHNFCYLILVTANRDHVQIKQGLNRRKGGHNRLVKSYEKLRQEMQSLITAGKAPCGGQVPESLIRDGLWDLDPDDDLWIELAMEGRSREEGAPKWLYDRPMRQGIHAMLELQRCKEETERLNHERMTMHLWLQAEKDRLSYASSIAQGSS